MVALMLTACGLGAIAGELVKISTRTDIKATVFWHFTEGATATLFIFPGGGGGFGGLPGLPGPGQRGFGGFPGLPGLPGKKK